MTGKVNGRRRDNGQGVDDHVARLIRQQIPVVHELPLDQRGFGGLVRRLQPAKMPDKDKPLPPRWHSCNAMSRQQRTQIIDGNVRIEYCCGRWRMLDMAGGQPGYWEGAKNSRRRTRR